MFRTFEPMICRCQFRPSGEIHTTPWLCASEPPARKPVAVLVTTQTWSPGTWLTPCAAASFHDLPSWLVQIACGPTASQPPGPPASSGANAPGLPWTGASCQLVPPSLETKNCWLVLEPTVRCAVATSVFPDATMRFSDSNTPRWTRSG